MGRREAAGLAMVVGLALVVVAGADGGSGPRPGTGGGGWAAGVPEDREPRAGDPAARRRWALRKMDEVANERLRCRERFRARGEIERCEAEYARRHRAYNELYLEAVRDDERVGRGRPPGPER